MRASFGAPFLLDAGMAITLRSFATTVSTAVATAQASCADLLDMGIGSPGRALIESVAGVGLWLQYLGLQILSRTRLATSVGTDCDSFVNDFGMVRLVGTAATGSVTMTCFSPVGQSAVVPAGVLVRTVSGLTFTVVEDSGSALWSAAQGGYVRAAGTAAITVPVEAMVAGTSGNVAAGALCLMGTSVAGIDTVTNPVAFSNGSDAETDAALRVRFPLWLAAKASGCVSAVENAVAGVQTDISDAVMDGLAADGAVRAGYFTVVIDDGSGAPSDTLVQSVYSAVDAVRACGVGFAVQRPTVLTLTVSMMVTVPASADAVAVQTTLEAAIAADIEACSVGEGYAYSRLAYLAYSAAGVSVVSVTDVLLNGAQADIAAATTQALVAGAISVQVAQS